MSRPSSSVPNQCGRDGELSRSGRLMAAGSWGAIHGANTAKITKRMTSTTPAAASGLWRAFPTMRWKEMAEVDTSPMLNPTPANFESDRVIPRHLDRLARTGISGTPCRDRTSLLHGSRGCKRRAPGSCPLPDPLNGEDTEFRRYRGRILGCETGAARAISGYFDWAESGFSSKNFQASSLP